jgi:3,4-dihydroxy-2-butanone 4-phosphate synthase
MVIKFSQEGVTKMTDEERIEMHFKYGLIDWKSEQSSCKMKKEKPAFCLWVIVKKMLTGIVKNDKKI